MEALRKRFIKVSTVTSLVLLSLLASNAAGWTAYNDCVYNASDSAHYIADNVTTYNIGSGGPGPSSGELVDLTTAAATGVTATLTQSGGVVWQPSVSSGGHDTVNGTDAYNTFGGIADMTGVTYYGGSPGWYVDLIFTGLDANKEYTFATSAARSNVNYTNRNTIYKISGADTYANASTTGVTVTSEAEVWFNTGDNDSEGYVARWTGITASDGTFTVRATHHPVTQDDRKAYAFDVFMLEEKEGDIVKVEPVTFAVIGDYGDNTPGEEDVATMVAGWEPNFVVTTGDNSYDSTDIDVNIGQYYSSFIGNYIGSYGPGSAVNRFFPSLGNHDYSDGGGINAYLNYFTLPGSGVASSNTSGNERYYDVVQGPVHIFVINCVSSEPDGTSSTSTQGQWLQTQLAASTSPWKIVALHYPPYTSASHGPSVVMQWPYKEWGATAVLAGHDHVYERIDKDGLLYFTCGHGGRSLYGIGTPDPDSQLFYNSAFGAMMVTATNTSIKFESWSVAGGGTLVDSAEIVKPTAETTITCEDFNNGFSGAVGSHADWSPDGGGPTVTSGTGSDGSAGLGTSGTVFTWTAHSFDWNDPTLTKVAFQMDFETEADGSFDDDRCVWNIDGASASSSNLFGAQLDYIDGGIVTYWRDSGGTRIQTPIVNLYPPDPGLVPIKGNTWYRFRNEITKLTATSARLDVSLVELDAQGDPTGIPYTGTVADTSLWPGGVPDTKYFTAATMYPAYKNYNGVANADHACFEVTTGTVTTYSISGNIVDLGGLPVDGIEVSADNSGGSDTTDANGDYVLTINENWSGTVTPTKSGYTFEPASTSYTTVTANQTEQDYVASAVSVSAGWTAYNDCVYDVTLDQSATNPIGQSVHYIADNVTIYNIGNNSPGPASGELVDFATGTSTGVTATLTQSGGVIWQPDVSSNWYGGYDTADGTDARNTFGGIADMTGVTYYGGSAGWYVDLTFTGLDANKEYTFATSAARCNGAYTDRGSIFSISGAETYTNASTAGVNVTSEAEVWFNTGDNYNEGYVARWTGITASDGTFTVRATHHASANSGRKAYAFDVFMLEKEGGPVAGPEVTFAVIGDYGDGSSDEGAVATMIDGWGPDFIVTTGDNSYGSNPIDINIGQFYSSFIGNYTGAYGAGATVNSFFPSIGNHDYSDGGGISAYLNYFTLPGSSVESSNTSGNERYYDVVQGPVHVFAINCVGSEPDGTSSTSVQGQWLQGQLAASTSPWKIVILHYPPYSSSSSHGPTPGMQWPYKEWGVTAVFAGHDHVYERIEKDGLRYFTCGHSGKSLYGLGTLDPDSKFFYNSAYGAMLVKATNTSIKFESWSVASGGTLVDSDEIVKPASIVFTAYNDLAWATGQLEGNTTKISSPNGGTGLPSSGKLVNFDTGDETNITLSVTGGNYNGGSTQSGQGPYPAQGTEAYDIFSGKVSGQGHISYQQIAPPAGNLVLTLTGMSPANTYNIVLYGHRDNYAWLRASLNTISGADAFTNNSSVATDNNGQPLFSGPDDASTRMPSDNDNGYVTRFDNVAPGSDGQIVLTISFDGDPGSLYKGKYASALMVQELGDAPPSPPAPPVEFVAYNDMNPDSSTNADNVTEHDYTASSAALIDFGSGIELPVTVTGTTVNGYDPYPNGGNFTNAGSDAYKAFDGIVDMAGVFELDFADWDHIVSFNDLDPNNEYAVTLTANRDNPSYADQRYTRVTIEGADAFTNASSAGVTVNSENSVTFCIGYNTVNGYVAKWTGIKTGPDGSFSVKSEWDNGFAGSKGYAMTAFCLEAFGPPQLLPVMEGDEWAYFKGTEEPPAEWTLLDFDDSQWLTGPTGIGYSDGDDATVLSDMRYTYVSVYARKVFTVAEPNDVTRLLLSMDYDDSFVAYLNGVEVARKNVTGNPPTYDLPADSDHESSWNGSNPVEFFQIDTNLLVTGKNVLAIQGHNKSLSSSDFTMIPQLLSVDYDWVAFVDLNSAAQVNDNTHPFALGLDPWAAAFTTTNWTLKDFDTGSDLPAALSIAMDIRYPTNNNGGNCNFNTDSDAFFGGIIDLLGGMEIDQVNTFLTTTFKNLDAAMEYEVVVTYNRDNPPYTDRVSRFEISDADTFVQASSDGVVVNSEGSVSFCTGYNTVNGYVARWTGVTTSSGIFAITATQDKSKAQWQGSKAYTMTAVMLKQVGPHSLEPDMTAPVISNILATPTSTSATVTCTTDEYTTSSVAYGPTTAYENGSVVNNTRLINHSAELTGLSPGNEYHYQITCTDYSGNETKSADLTFTTSSTIYSEDFQAYQAGSDPQGWFDTASGNSLVQDDSLFNTLSENSNMAFGTSSSATNIHSHYVAGQSSQWTDYTYSGKMMISSSGSGIGVTILSDYPNSDSYYRLRRYGSNGFHISAHGTSITSGNVNTGVVPSAGTWYKFAVKVTDAGTYTEIAAKVWPDDGTPEPVDWQALCYDANADRLTQGTIGVWTMASGTKYFDDLKVEPEIVVPDNTAPIISNILALPSNTSAKVTCTTDEPATSSIAYGPTTAYENGSTVNNNFATNHSGTLTGLAPNTLYHFQITCTDESGNETKSADSTFTTTLTPVISTLYSEDFNAYQHLDEPQGWVDTGGGNSLVQNDGLFKVLAEDGNRAFGTTSSASNIHSHYIADQSSDWTDYTFSGRMMMTSSGSGIGVTVLSDYVNSDSYYRLRRYGSNGFHISPHGTSITSGNTSTGVVPQPNQWYRFIIKVEATDTHTEIKAKVWQDGTTEPANWQVECQDASGGRLTKGTIGVWSMSSGTKYFDDLEVEPEIVVPDNTAPVISNVAARPSATNASITCTTDEPATSSVAYGLTGAYEMGTVTNSTRTTNHSVMLTGLTPVILYYYQVTCTDKSGNATTATGSTFTTTDTPATIYSEDFSSYSAGDDPQGWVDTNSGNKLTQNDSLFKVQQPNGDVTFGTTSSAKNIHSHYLDGQSSNWTNYQFRGKMMIANGSAGIGVTFLSDFVSSDSYYRLRRYNTGAFHISPHGTTITSGNTSTDVVPLANVWYEFRIEVNDTGTQTEIRAKVWQSGTSEPNWQVDCYDASPNRLTRGTIGVWSMSSGTKYFGDLEVE